MSRRWFYALFFLLPLTVVFGHRGLAPWLLLASLPAFARGAFWQSAFGKLFDNPSLGDPKFASFASLLFLCVWIFLSGFWSPKHQYTLLFYVLGPALVGASIIWFSLSLTREWAWRLGQAFLWALVAGMAILSFEGVSEGFLRAHLPPGGASDDRIRDIIALGRGVTALAPALFPAAAIAVRQWSRKAALFVLAMGAVAAISNDVLANVVAIGAGLAAAALALGAQRITLQLAGWGAIAMLVLAPFVAALIPVDAIFAHVAQNASPETATAMSSSLHRLAIWKAAAREAFSCLPFGCGADYARIWNATAQTVMVPGEPAALSVIPNHPHNVFLQIWLELGLPGVAALAAFVWFGLAALLRARLSKAVGAAAAGAFVAILVSIMVEGSLWQVWRLAAMALAASGVALAHMLEKR
ncbi:O-antigen ligase family protein [Hyphococcus sp.]|uniref:O-antigen ligase family protein n=1 Tax=Hyphococcus sp. TaxID=2038636 RepID=UPI0020889521|nr:MAG: polymerase [Marinicaulis sp.]